MVERILRGASLAMLAALAIWRPSPSRDAGLDVVLCAGAAVLAATYLFRHAIQLHLAPLAASGPPSGGDAR